MRTPVLILLAAALLSACATSPTGRKQLRLVSDDEMSQMGIAAFSEMKQKTPLTKDGKTNSYVQCIARALTNETGGGPWELQVFEAKDVNAFALPGGKMGVYTGLLKVAANQDQLAAVVGHEIAHVIAGHSAARASNEMATQLGVGLLTQSGKVSASTLELGANLLQVGILLPFSRGDESESDILGLEYMARAGFDPRQAPELWRNMARASGGGGPPQFLSTHPSNETRIRDLENHMPVALPLFEQARAAGKRPRCS